jgi:hypothetical protein
VHFLAQTEVLKRADRQRQRIKLMVSLRGSAPEFAGLL